MQDTLNRAHAQWLIQRFAAIVLLAALVACGGGGNDNCTGCTDENGRVPPPANQLPCQANGTCL